MRSAFITVEGSEGAGKSTNLSAIEDRLRERDLPFITTREPGGTDMAEAIRALLLDKRDEPVDPLTELLLVFAARRQHMNQVIRPNLARGVTVLCDRFTDATYAYQGGGRGLPNQWIATLEDWVQDDVRPDLTVYLDVPPEMGAARISDRENDRVESEARTFFDAVRAAYLDRAETIDAMIVIDAGRPLPEVRRSVEQAIDGFLEARLG